MSFTFAPIFTPSAPAAGITASSAPTVVAATMPAVVIFPSGNPQAATVPTGTTAGINPYIFTPSFSVAVGGSVAFLLLGAILSIQLIRSRSWYFNLAPQAAFVETAGMIARTHSTLHLSNVTAFAIQLFGTMIVPGSITAIATIFTFTRLMWWVTPNDKRNMQQIGLPVKWVSAIWAGMSIGCDIAKGLGMNVHTISFASKIQLIGMVVQVFVFAGFAIFASRFMIRAQRWAVNGNAESKSWEKLGWTIVAAMTVLTGRAIFQVVEFDGQPKIPSTSAAAAATAAMTPMLSFVATHEWPFWFGDVLPILTALSLFAWNNPGHYLPREYTKLVFKIKDIERIQSMSNWQATISNPIQIEDEEDLKGRDRFIVQQVAVQRRRDVLPGTAYGGE